MLQSLGAADGGGERRGDGAKAAEGEHPQPGQRKQLVGHGEEVAKLDEADLHQVRQLAHGGGQLLDGARAGGASADVKHAEGGQPVEALRQAPQARAVQMDLGQGGSEATEGIGQLPQRHASLQV